MPLQAHPPFEVGEDLSAASRPLQVSAPSVLLAINAAEACERGSFYIPKEYTRDKKKKKNAAWRVSVSVSASAHTYAWELRARRPEQGVYLYIWFILTNSVLFADDSVLLYTESISNYEVVQPVIIHRDSSIEVSKG